MTLTSTTNRSSHTGNNSTTAFSYSFKVFDQSEIDVYLDGVKKTITTHYTVSGVGADAGGTVTFESDTVPGSGVAIVFVRNIAQTQTTDYTVTGQINPQTIEDALDKITMRNQKVQLNADESFGFADSVTDAGTVRISATSANRASKVLAFDSSGNLNADQEIGTSKGNWATSTAYVVRDIIKDTSNNNIYICLTAHTSSGSQPISSNTDSAKWRLLVDAASATTSQTAAAASATAAASSATAAASSASAASTSATNSASSATTSSTQASNSASSATSSASSATSSSTSATSSSNYATKVDGAVTGTDYSAKAWAVGGTGVTDTSSRGAAKEWATAAEDDQVDGSEYSAKHYATKAAASATSAASSAAGMEAATIKDGTYWGYTTAGSANTYTLTTSPTISSYAADMFYHIKVNASNTGASTINVDSVGAKNIKKYGGAGMVDLAANDLESGGVYTIIYDGTQFLLLGGSATDSQVDINTADIFMLNSRRLSDHSANVLNTVDGFVDDFQDGSTQNNTAINISGSTNIAHDNTSKYWQNSRGSAGQTTDTAYTTESNYTQQEWTTAIVGSSNATFTNSSATVTISSGTWPANCDNGRISQDGTNWYDIASRDSATQLTLTSSFSQSTVTGTYTIRLTEFSGGKVQLNNNGTHNVITEPVTTVPTFATLKDASAWSDLNSVAITDTPYDAAKTFTATGNAKIKTSDALGSTDKDEFNTNGNASYATGTVANYRRLQVFTATSSYSLSSISLYLSKYGSPTDNITVAIYGATGSSGSKKPDTTLHGTSNAVDGSTLKTISSAGAFEGEWVNFTFSSPISISSGTSYCIVPDRSGSGDNANYYYWGVYDSGSYENIGAGLTEAEDPTNTSHWAVYSQSHYFLCNPTAVTPKFGTGMMSVSTGGDNYISTADSDDWNCDGNFAIDFWMNHRTLVSSGNIVLQFEDTNNYNHFSLSGTTDVEWKVKTGGGNHWAQASSSLGCRQVLGIMLL